MELTHPLLAALAAQRLLPVLRSPEAGAALARTRQLLGAGCRVVELTTSTPGWRDALAGARAELGAEAGAFLGLGTVTTAGQARDAVAAGAAFLVSPFPAPEVREVARGAGVLFVEGGFTPAEVADAASRGPAKVFPAHVGGPQYLRSLRAVLPSAVLIPTGGIPVEGADAYLAAGALAVGVGSGLPADPEALAAVFAA
ncbi:bifunctional 4-hydroxy-2-oxoglutarate aldolase/2-dehydro-3-deoxy-phosphogluconate aldolase [Streptomyces hoynatensis]|uniref:Aldolase n=1 Tax=Streptomyces hoynatensis TaxID=1141874 RepID=A0A3A9YWA2_9ACTN|nr:bifunctional 4-hydroxy-2-oxoglutarate aldolase/2-dehydro-3-deoxy-phosphogluconate aldolase [Streptomyces hoynatensis]RKN39496.1 aldolase [Streptomyces hoynatensis]